MLTEQDLGALSNLLDIKFKNEFITFKQEFKSEFDDLKLDVISEFNNFRSEFDEFKTKITSDFDVLRNQCLSDIARLEQRLIRVEQRLIKAEQRLIRVEVDLLENNVIPRLNTIESCYTSTYYKYQNQADKFDSMYQDVDVIKKVVTHHSEQIQAIQRIS